MSSIGVVHLIRAANGTEPLKRFLVSYVENPAGVEHDLLIVFKGFRNETETAEYRNLLPSFPYKELFVSDEGYDIDAYYKAANTFAYDYFCFLNSYSQILAPDWLKKLYTYAVQEGVGLVGSTGSYQTPASAITLSPRFPKELLVSRNPYKRFLIKKFPWLSVIRTRMRCWVYKRYFGPFPNYHIRTNAFMISRHTLSRIEFRPIRSKFEAYKFESGKNGLSKQIMRMNKRILVVGKDGVAYDKEDWFRSNTFWQGDQGNLLIADNQTNQYWDGDVAKKLMYSLVAWEETRE